MHRVLLIMVVLSLSITGKGWTADFRPGQYEITSQVQMTGMPEGAIPAQTFSNCLTEQNPVPSMDASSSGCTIKDFQQNGNTIKWTMACDQQGQTMTGEGTMTFSGDTFTGTSTMTMGPQAGNMQVVSRMTGKRTGDCQATQ